MEINNLKMEERNGKKRRYNSTEVHENFNVNFHLLEEAIENGDTESYNEMLERAPDKNPLVDFGKTALHFAAEKGEVICIRGRR